ncbi:MAG: hypothetical protein Q8K99_13090 [Actinomycetota bacterium]|nr:hypothetical protein [Actinomycetota bacterium]
MECEHSMDFGWEGDNGLGEELITQALSGVKTATCGFVRAYTPEELSRIRESVDSVIPIIDHHGTVRGFLRILDVFETPFGAPDLRLVRGEGDGDDVAKFQADHRIVWELDFAGEQLHDDEPLLVEIFELAEEPVPGT